MFSLPSGNSCFLHAQLPLTGIIAILLLIVLKQCSHLKLDFGTASLSIIIVQNSFQWDLGIVVHLKHIFHRVKSGSSSQLFISSTKK